MKAWMMGFAVAAAVSVNGYASETGTNSFMSYPPSMGQHSLLTVKQVRPASAVRPMTLHAGVQEPHVVCPPAAPVALKSGRKVTFVQRQDYTPGYTAAIQTNAPELIPVEHRYVPAATYSGTLISRGRVEKVTRSEVTQVTSERTIEK